MQKDFITVTPDSGKSGSTTVTATATKNETDSARTVKLSVSGGGMTRTVTLTQAAQAVTWNYYFSVTPISLSFNFGGGNKSVKVTSYRKKVVNGVETSTQESVAWTSTIIGDGFSKNSDGTTITAVSNQGSSRSGTVSYTQGTSGKTATVTLTQTAVEYTITYTNSAENYSYCILNSSSTPTGSPSKYDLYMGGIEFENIWNPTSGYLVNNVNNNIESVKLYAGDTVYIRKISDSSMTWSNSTVQSFTLKAENQTITLR